DDATDLKVAGPLSTGLPPVAVTFDHATDQVLAVSPVATPAPKVALSAARPNPASTRVRLALELADGGDTRVDVWDVAGRRVGTLTAGTLTAGAHALAWDLADEHGTPVRAGVYLIRATQRGAALGTARVVVVR
ncbi:MAG TPA: FlgD immunoglobulin-like domain containing protein, partial [Dongiaceae bacterium]|nr:FlgD immunoglobulin-like domain containing protein [Dongiaceae bacterium]